MKPLLGVAVAAVTALMTLGSEVALAGKPGPYVQVYAPKQGIYLQVGGNPNYGRSWGWEQPTYRRSISSYGRTVIVQPQGQGHYRDRYDQDQYYRDHRDRGGTVIVAPEAETIIIQNGGYGSTRPRVITRDRYRGVYGDRDGYSVRPIGGATFYPPYPYGNSGSRTLRSCYPASWRNSAFNTLASRSCY